MRIEKSFSEVLRVLKPGGEFLIINRYRKQGSKWWKMAKMKDDKEYIEYIDKAGFKGIKIELDRRKGWIIATARKR